MIGINNRGLRYHIFTICTVLISNVTIYAVNSFRQDERRARTGYREQKVQEQKPSGHKEPWDTYINHELNFTLRYPQGLEPLPNPDTVRFDLEHLSSPTAIYSIQFISRQPELNTGGVTLEIWTNTSSLSASGWLDQQFPGIRDYSEVKEMKLRGTAGLQWVGGEGVLFIDTLLPVDNRIFWIRLRLPNNERDVDIEADYQSIIESLVP